MKKLKYLAWLTVILIAVASVYIYCAKSNNPSLFFVFPLYQIIAVAGACIYMLLFFYHNNEIGKAKMSGKEPDEQACTKRRNMMKWCIVIFFPFVAVVLCDYTYLLLLKDNIMFQSFMKIFG